MEIANDRALNDIFLFQELNLISEAFLAVSFEIIERGNMLKSEFVLDIGSLYNVIQCILYCSTCSMHLSKYFLNLFIRPSFFFLIRFHFLLRNKALNCIVHYARYDITLTLANNFFPLLFAVSVPIIQDWCYTKSVERGIANI